MSTISENLTQIIAEIPEEVTLVAVSKTKPISDLEEAYKAGQRVFGENKVQEMVHKWETLPKDIEWHMIGHLQRNKVKYIAPFVHLIHGVDSERLLSEINKQGEKIDRKISILLQIHIAKEETKFGLSPEELSMIMQQYQSGVFPYITIKGLMGMATFTENVSQIKSEFEFLKKLFDQYEGLQSWETLSMGMSGDYPIAIAQGSTMIRVGSSIFGHRNYT